MFTMFTPQMVIAGVQQQGGNCKQQARRSTALSARIACLSASLRASGLPHPPAHEHCIATCLPAHCPA